MHICICISFTNLKRNLESLRLVVPSPRFYGKKASSEPNQRSGEGKIPRLLSNKRKYSYLVFKDNAFYLIKNPLASKINENKIKNNKKLSDFDN